ncbi:DUF2384 domain-containing protein [Enterobacteriaceae bacterium 4M9]|nr:DUF2384 domain-containing protein [Enterobacteriaceae bacterium 4M9]
MGDKRKSGHRYPEGQELKFSTLSGPELTAMHAKKERHYLVMEVPQQYDAFIDSRAFELAVESALRLTVSLADVPEPAMQRVTAPAQQARLAQLNQRIFSEAEWLTARDVSERAGLAASNPSAGPNRWKAKKRIFAVPVNGRDYYPAYALDEGSAPLPVISQLLALFGDRKTPWGLAVWLGSDNGWLGGRKPKDVLASEPDAVLAAAEQELQGPVHG